MKKIIVTGNVGKDPEIRASADGTEFATFSIGVRVGTAQNPTTDWVDISVNGKLVDIVRNYVRKSSKVLIEGFPSVNAYINKENKAVGTLKVNAHTLELLDKKDNNNDKIDADRHYELPSGNFKSDEIPF